MAIWSQFRSILFGGAIGAAARTAIEPQIEPARQEAWRNNTNRILDLPELGMLLAQGLIDPAQATDHAKRNGYDQEKLDALAQLSLHAPSVAEAMHAWRLGEIDFARVQHALRKAGIEPRWDATFERQKTLPLAPADLANAVQQGFVPNAGLLPGDPGGALPITPPVEEIPLRTLDEFVAGAVDGDHAKVLAQLVGLPPGVMELLQMWNRGIITEQAVAHGIREGHTKTKWTSALKELRHFILSPAEAAGLRLRGWIDQTEANRLGALSGASSEVMERLYQNRGRPAAPGQMATAAVRGIDGPLGRPMDEAQFLIGIRESDIRPEWGPMLWQSRFLYPSLFQLNRLVTGGAIDVPTGVAWAKKARYAPEVVTALERSWSTTVGPALWDATADAAATAARTAARPSSAHMRLRFCIKSPSMLGGQDHTEPAGGRFRVECRAATAALAMGRSYPFRGRRSYGCCKCGIQVCILVAACARLGPWP